MAASNFSEVGNKFGKRLSRLAEAAGLLSASQIAEELYKRDDCFKIIRPRGRVDKILPNKSKDVTAIARTVQRHLFTVEEKFHISSEYMYAYHVLFNVSLDYLYGVVEDPVPNVEVAAISEKTGLAVEAVENLMSDEEISLDEYLAPLKRYDFSGLERDDGEQGEGVYPKVCRPLASFWSWILGCNLYKELPEAWYQMACAFYVSKAVDLLSQDVLLDMTRTLTWERFRKAIDEWNAAHNDYAIAPLSGMTIQESFEANRNWAEEMYIKARTARYYSAPTKKQEYEMIYMGCTGKFDSLIRASFHDEAERWYLLWLAPYIKN